MTNEQQGKLVKDIQVEQQPMAELWESIRALRYTIRLIDDKVEAINRIETKISDINDKLWYIENALKVAHVIEEDVDTSENDVDTPQPQSLNNSNTSDN